jgi:hypothetical protein
MSETNKPVFQVTPQLFQQLAEWQEKIAREDELASDAEEGKQTEVKNPIKSHEKHSQTDNS